MKVLPLITRLKQLVYGPDVLRPPTPEHSLHEQLREGLDPIDDVI